MQLLCLVLLMLLQYSCKQKNQQPDQIISSFISPESGTIIKAGESVELKINFKDAQIDSVQYFLDSTRLTVKNDSSAFVFKTSGFALGNRLITAKIFNKESTEEVNTNIVIVSSKVPDQYGFEIVNTYNHDVTSYTEGLEYKDGIFYESDGAYGESSLRKVSIDGKVLQQKDIDAKYFAEGIAVIGNKILQLTYREREMLEYDKNTLEMLRKIPYNHANEGWGMAFNGKTIFNTDGSNKIFKLNKDTYQSEGYLEVYDDKGPVMQLNELEWVDGKLYANIFTSDLIAIINPETGEVEAYINLTGILKDPLEDPGNMVLNGIAWDAANKRLFVTGKKWPKLFEIELVKR